MRTHIFAIPAGGAARIGMTRNLADVAALWRLSQPVLCDPNTWIKL